MHIINSYRKTAYWEWHSGLTPGPPVAVRFLLCTFSHPLPFHPSALCFDINAIVLSHHLDLWLDFIFMRHLLATPIRRSNSLSSSVKYGLWNARGPSKSLQRICKNKIVSIILCHPLPFHFYPLPTLWGSLPGVIWCVMTNTGQCVNERFKHFSVFIILSFNIFKTVNKGF